MLQFMFLILGQSKRSVRDTDGRLVMVLTDFVARAVQDGGQASF